MHISLTGPSQQGMIKRSEGISCMHGKSESFHLSTGKGTACDRRPGALSPTNWPTVWTGIILGAFVQNLFPTSWLVCMVRLCDDGGVPIPAYHSVRLCDSHLCAGMQMPVFSLDESGNPPLSSVHKLKNADLMFLRDLTGVFRRFLSSQNKTKTPNHIARCYTAGIL